MLSLPSVNSTPSVVSRPVLMVDAALRPAAAARVIEPTTAISKERSRVETRSPEGLAKPVVQGPAAPAPRPDAQAQAQAQVQSPTYGVTRSRPSLTDRPLISWSGFLISTPQERSARTNTPRTTPSTRFNDPVPAGLPSRSFSSD